MVPLDADLPNMPLVRVNGLANLLAVNTKCNEVKILASPDGLLLLRAALQHKMLPCAMEAIEISSSGNGVNGPVLPSPHIPCPFSAVQVANTW